MGSAGAPARDHPQVYLAGRGAWRDWLERNHDRRRGVWVVFYKKATGKPTMAYEEAVEEALCFGWVDSRTRRLDVERYVLMFTPRNPAGPWSRPNKERVARLVESGRMAPAGMALVDEARRNGAWTVYDPIEDLVIPEDLEAALADHRSARENFDALGVSTKKSVLWWIAGARRPDTRARRIARTAAAAARKTSPL